MPRAATFAWIAWATAAAGQGFAPEVAVRRMETPPDLRVRLVASEPLLRQPVAIGFDDRGRLWCMQYLQYPTPAGIKPVAVDRYLRTKYDRLPEPPPHGPRGADRLTYSTKIDAEGRVAETKDFIDGLNLATGCLHGDDGVYVLQAPYLLFYPDRDRKGVPDGPPEVLLTGFGMEDAHAFANSLAWGPDGWLYGVQGSTVTANIRGIAFQQGIWRLHPKSKRFELFAEGGGNTWGLDFDAAGHAIASTNMGGRTSLHQVQGGYYVKGFEKHGALQNPHAYGYFEHCEYEGFVGGHVNCGGVVYQGDVLPPRYRGKLVAADLLTNAVRWHELVPDRSTFRNRRGGDMVVAHDTWFRPVDCEVGPDGCIYVADWTDQRANHVDPKDDWDRSNGRVYRIEPRDGAPPVELPDFATLPAEKLAAFRTDANIWRFRRALRVLHHRQDASAAPMLREALAREGAEPNAVRTLWMLYACRGLDESAACKCLRHPDAAVRAWTIRLLGDENRLPAAFADDLVRRLPDEPDATVRSQAACTAKRLPTAQCLAVLSALVQRDADRGDPFIPLLCWWALEAQVAANMPDCVGWLLRPEIRGSQLVRSALLERAARRLLAEATDAGDAAAAKLLGANVDDDFRGRVLQGLAAAAVGRKPAGLPAPLQPLLAANRGNELVLRIGLAFGDAPALEVARAIVLDARSDPRRRQAMVELLGRTAPVSFVPLFAKLAGEPGPAGLRSAALAAAAKHAAPEAEAALLALARTERGNLRNQALAALAARPAWAKALLAEIDAGKIAAADVPPDTVQLLATHQDAALTALVEKRWGKFRGAPAAEKMARVHGIKVSLGLAAGDAKRGRELFRKHCGNCHALFGEGAKVGPELTGAERQNLDFLLTSIVDPSAAIRKEFVSQVVRMEDGRTLVGLLTDADANTAVLVDAKAERHALRKAEIAETRPAPNSLMPEGLLDALDAQQVRDLVGYLQAKEPPR